MKVCFYFLLVLAFLPVLVSSLNIKPTDGVEVEKGRHPSVVALVASGSDKVICSGFLFELDIVITAASCSGVFENYNNDIHAVINRHDFSDTSESNYENIKVVGMSKHPSYDQNTLDYNIMLLKLETKANDEILTAAIGHGVDSIEMSEEVTVIGWGNHQVLKEYQLIVTEDGVCNSIYSNPLTKNELCVSYDGLNGGFCDGDIGGPLITKGRNVYNDYVFGLMSRADNCDQAGVIVKLGDDFMLNNVYADMLNEIELLIVDEDESNDKPENEDEDESNDKPEDEDEDEPNDKPEDEDEDEPNDKPEDEDEDEPNDKPEDEDEGESVEGLNVINFMVYITYLFIVLLGVCV